MIDTLKAKQAGFTDDQIEVLRDRDKDLVTKDYLDARLAELGARFAPLDIQIKIAIGLGIAIFIKSFF